MPIDPKTVKVLTPRVTPAEAELIKEAAYRARVSKSVWMRRRMGLPDRFTNDATKAELHHDLYGVPVEEAEPTPADIEAAAARAGLAQWEDT